MSDEATGIRAMVLRVQRLNDWPAFHRQTNADVILSTCRGGHSVAAPNTGLGRAKVAAWESRHQHRGEASS